MQCNIVTYVQQAAQRGDDRIKFFYHKDNIVILLADGAGGFGDGGKAADFFIEQSYYHITNLQKLNNDILENILRKIDRDLHDNGHGETTSIIAIINAETIFGASVGDSHCYLFNKEFVIHATSLQYRKPLLGSGKITAISFGPFHIDNKVVIASDGLFDYTTINNIRETLTYDMENIGQQLLSLVELPSRKLQDDFSVIVYKI
ncbi:hypothetical protein [Candidatus Uabimicrobium sp. HlEnr_7]|uniref:hypothetical protein n=1 Tax=Candidatus Uabimicrobium helgolandensis TaxID=3095367 RepID=UPI0035585813